MLALARHPARLLSLAGVLAWLPAPAAAQALWNVVPGLTSRSESASAYDAARGVTILFGGDDGASRDDMWQWDGTTWTELSPPTRPPARRAHAMVYDSLRQRTLLYGGDTAAGTTAELWSWNGTTWTPITTANSPGPRAGHAMAYDAARDRVILYVGWNTPSAMLWEFDGTDWSQVPIVLPNWPPVTQQKPLLAYDPVAGNTALFVPHPSAGKMWRWNGSVWSSQTGPAFFVVLGSRMVHDPIRQRLLLVSGVPVQPTGPTMFAWNPATASWQGLANVGPVGDTNTVSFDVARDRVVLVGGYAVGTWADSSVWEWNGTQWARRTYAPPPVRYDHAMAHDRANYRLVVFGGNHGGDLADTWVRTQGRWELAVPQPPSATMGHPGVQHGSRLVHDEARNQTLLVGGSSAFVFWRLAGNQWLQVPSAVFPPAREDCGLVYDRARQRVVLFGGGPHPYRNDTWTWNGTVWTQLTTVNAPPPRREMGIAYDALRDRIVVLGGYLSSGTLSDTWEFDGVDWALRSSGALPSTNLPRLAYDEPRQITVALIAPQTGPLQTWQWDGTTWSLASPTSTPPPRGGACLVGTGTDVLLFGGRNGSVEPAPMWSLTTPTLARLDPFGIAGTSSAGALTLRGTGALPWTGSRCRLEFGTLPAFALPGLWVGLSRTTWQGLALPLALGFAGYPGSTLYISLDGPWPVLNNGTGAAVADVDLPAGPSLLGLQLLFQGFVYEPLTAAVTTTNGLQMTIGSR